MKLKIGKIELENNLILAPMAGVSNAAFRQIARACGAGLCYAEMISDKGLMHGNTKTKSLLFNIEGEHPYAQQIFGESLESMVEAAKFVNDNTDADIIDINMGCPVPKVSVKSQAGASLLKNPEKIYQIVKEIKKVINKPLTVKIRTGWDKQSINAVEVAKTIEKAGADAIIIHGLTRSEMYSGQVDLDIIKEVKNAVKIPVIGNGDIVCGPSAKKMLDYTGVDGIMIGRAALGNPWIFAEIDYYLKTGKTKERPSLNEIKQMLINHYEKLIEIKGEHPATLEIRGQGVWYFKGLPGAKQSKIQLAKVSSRVEFYEIVESYFKSV